MTSLDRHGSAETAGPLTAELVGRALLDSGLSAILVIDGNGRIVEFSPAAEEMFGHPRDAVLGREMADLIIPSLLRDSHRRGLRRHLITGRSLFLDRVTEHTVLRADGSEFPVEISISRVPGANPPLFVGFVRDITERRQVENRLAKSRALLAEAEELARSGSFEHDLRTGRVEWSDGIHRVFGLPPGTIPSSLEVALQTIHPDDRERVRHALRETIRSGDARLLEHVRVVRADGIERIVELAGKLVRDDYGRAEHLVGTARDVTEAVEADRTRDLLSYVVESSDDAIITESADGIVTSWNRGAERLYGYAAEEAIGRPVGMIVPAHRSAEQAEVTRRVFGGESIRRLETERLRKDGTEVPVSLTVSPVRDHNGRIVSVALMARDVTERRRYEQRLQYLAEHDHLTGLVNRRRFDEELQREIGRAERTGQGGAVLSVDLDEFKAINDSAGHAAGDAVLGQVARALREHTRDSDVVARFGGDEFAVLLPGVGREEAQAAAEHLLDALHACAVDVDGTSFRVNASIGVALFEPGSTDREETVVSADLAMYAAKRQGRDRVVVYSVAEAQAARADARLSWSQRIRHALDNEGLVLHWQAIVGLDTGEPSHGELLLRMRSGEKLLAPREFLAAAERLGLIHAIDRWVVLEAIRLLARGNGPARLPLSVNLSGESVAGDPELLGLIERELARSGVDPARLIFEVTETAAIANIVEARRFALGVHRLGCQIALDDFGTGFGSFYHLKHLPVDFIKIDREFVHNLPDSTVDQRLVRAIVDVARTLRIRTVAESVGDDRTVELLRELEVDYIQGFHVGPPRPIE